MIFHAVNQLRLHNKRFNPGLKTGDAIEILHELQGYSCFLTII